MILNSVYLLLSILHYFLHEQHSLFDSTSLKNGKGAATLGIPIAQGQHSTLGTQLGFSQTNSHLGLGH
jgi:hypothetical protein